MQLVIHKIGTDPHFIGEQWFWCTLIVIKKKTNLKENIKNQGKLNCTTTEIVVTKYN